MPKMTADDKAMHERMMAEQDARTLQEARAIMRDKKRMGRAQKHVAEMQKAVGGAQTVMNSDMMDEG